MVQIQRSDFIDKLVFVLHFSFIVMLIGYQNWCEMAAYYIYFVYRYP